MRCRESQRDSTSGIAWAARIGARWVYQKGTAPLLISISESSLRGPCPVDRCHEEVCFMTLQQREPYTVKGACPQDCPDGCAMIYHVSDGKLISVTGDAGNSYTRGRLCAKLNNFAEHHSNPDRVLYPMRRSG